MLILSYIRFIISKSSIMMIYHHFTLNKKFKSKRAIIGFGVIVKNSELGKDVFIGQNTRVVNSTVGDNTYFNSETQVTNATIGKFCSIGSNVTIGIGSHPINMISTHPAFYSNNKGFKTFADKMYFKEETGIVEIGNDVWIGSDVTIFNNIKIGNGAVVALGSVVTKHVPDYAVVAGIPAKIIKYRFKKEEIEMFNNIKWWDFDSNEIEKKFTDFLDFHFFLNKYGKQ